MSSNATEHILIEGWLEKKSAKSDGTKHVLHLPSLWQKRYCVLGKFYNQFYSVLLYVDDNRTQRANSSLFLLIH